jgi:hypothetical protein
LFVSCPFTRQVWILLEGILKTKLTWEGLTVDDCLSSFVGKHQSFITLPATVCWYIWLERNNLLFNNGSTIPQVVATKVVSCYNASLVTQSVKATFKIKRPPRLQQIVGWFDGVASGDGLNSGVGGVISLNTNYHFKWTFNTGAGTNNRAELMGVWTTLFLSKIFNLQDHSNHWGLEACY